MPDPLPIIPGFSLVAGPFQSQWGTLYGMYEGTGDIPATLPDPYEYWLAGKNAAGNNALIIRPRKAPPAPPPLAMLMAPNKDDRGDGMRAPTNGASVRWADIHVEGYEQNLAATGCGSVELENVRSVKAWREKGSDAFVGQGLYADKCGPISLKSSLFGWNGWRADKPMQARNMYRHGVYANVHAGFVTAEDCIFIQNASAGIQIRNGAHLKRCILIGNAINVLAVRGEVTLEDCTIYTAARHVLTDDQGKPKRWAGNCGVYAYTGVRLKDTWLVGAPGQELPNTEIPGIGSDTIGALGIDKDHRDNPGGKGSYTAEGDCRVIGWPLPSGPGFPDVRPAGVTFGGAPVAFDYGPIIADVLANKVSVANASRRLADGIREAAAK